METRKTAFYIGRLNVIYSRTVDKKTFILESLGRNAQLSKKGFGWGFYETGQTSIEDRDFIVGFLVKYKLIEQWEKVFKSEGRLKPMELSDLALGKSKFILDINSGLIAYNPDSRNIREKTFRRIFVELFEKANNGFLVSAEIQLITEAHDFLSKFRELNEIHTVKITLHPSNPNIKPVWAEIDRVLKGMEAEKLGLTYQSKGNLKISEGSRANSEIMMAVDGYGKAEIYGVKDQESILVSTEKIPLRVMDVLEGDNKKIEKNVLAKLLSYIKRDEEQ